jgi:hypothetical protein
MRYAIFMSYGATQSYGAGVISGTPLLKMNTKDFASVEEAEAFINNTATIPSGVAYLILPFYQCTKPVQQA